MTAAQGPDERFVVPRWRTFATTLSVGELASPRGPGDSIALLPDQDPLDLDLFVSDPGLHLAGDLLGRTLHGAGEAADALPVADFVLESRDASVELRRLARAVRAVAAGEPLPLSSSFDVASVTDAASVVRAARASLRRNPRNPVRWIDLALAQTNTGELAKAERSILTAVSLAPANRFVLRAASRFFVHVGDPERAPAVVFQAARVMRDPWLLAAEIAAAEIAGPASRLIVAARRSLREGDFAPAQASELACAIASHELESGQGKAGRKMLERAMLEPTENAVAQAEFEARRGHFTLSDDLLAHEGTFEARALAHGARSQWKEAAADARKWQQDQSFASDPAMYLSYVAAVGLEDYSGAAQAAKIGLTANPGSAMLANNYAFALANLGEVDEASAVFEQYPSSSFEGWEQATRMATMGLIAFRREESARGRELYRGAYTSAADAGQRTQAAFAAVFWAREEVRIASPIARDLLEVARVEVERSDAKDPALVLERVEQEASVKPLAEVGAHDPASVPGILRGWLG